MAVPATPEDAVAAILAGARPGDLESDTLDFKEQGRSLDDTLRMLTRASACFANASGGTVVVGVRDHVAGPEAIVGTDLDPVRTQRRIYELTEPGLITTVDTMAVGSLGLMLIRVPASPDVHQVAGRATERVGSDCRPMTSGRIAAVVVERQGHDWSADDSTVPVEAVSARAIEEVRGLLRATGDTQREGWAALSVRDLCRRLGVLTTTGTLTNAGKVLLVGAPTAPLDYTHRRVRSGSLTVNERQEGPAAVVITRVLELIEVRTDRTPIQLANGQELFVADLPDVAVREAVVNAVMHRDYRVSAPVQVEHSATRLAVTSPGGFVFGVSPENVLTTSSRPRNPALANAIRTLGLAEAAGVGIDRMYAAMSAIGHGPPQFESDGLRVRATLNGGAPNTQLTRFITTLPVQRRDDPDTLLVLVHLLTSRTVTAEALAGPLQKGRDEIEVTLRQLAGSEADLLERTRGSATHRYGTYRLQGRVLAALGSAIAYRRLTGAATDQKIIDIVRETGTVNARLVRSVLDVDASTASRILGKLVREGVLTKSSEAQRGRSVTYGRGPRFPRRVKGQTEHARSGDE